MKDEEGLRTRENIYTQTYVHVHIHTHIHTYLTVLIPDVVCTRKTFFLTGVRVC